MSEAEEVKLEDKTVYLVGTAHVSEESVRDVERTIDLLKPDIVAVELCEQRLSALKEEKRWGETEITDVLKSGRIYLFLLQILLTNFQRKVGSKVGVKPGAEMLNAVKIAEDRKIQVALVDRNVGVTLKRAMKLLTLKEKLKLFSGLVYELIAGEEVSKELIEQLKKKDVLTELMEELAREAPSLKKVLVDERDEYIALSISSLKAKKVVAVIGAGHLEGVKRNLLQIQTKGHVGEGKQALEQTSIDKGINMKYAGYAIPALFLLLLVVVLWTKGPEMALKIGLVWIVSHSLLAALGVVLMMGHPVSIAIALVTAPITPFHPLSVGMLAAYAEFKMRKPRVNDFTELLNLGSIRDAYRNRVTRIFLIMLAADLCNNMASGLTILVGIIIPYFSKVIL